MQINNPLVHFVIVLFGMIFSYFAITHTIKNIKLLTQQIKMRKMQAKGGSSSVIINVETLSLQGSMHCVSDGSVMLCETNEAGTYVIKLQGGQRLTIENAKKDELKIEASGNSGGLGGGGDGPGYAIFMNPDEK